jgi:hypothetical protein
MKPIARWTLLLGVLLLLPGCGAQKKAAETAIQAAQTAYDGIKAQAVNVAPAEARAIEGAIAAAKADVQKGNFKAALAATQDLPNRVQELQAALPAKQAELDTAWKGLNATVPRTLASLGRKLGATSRRPAGMSRERFDAAKGELAHLKSQWSDAQAAMKDGRLAEAVGTAEDVKAWAARLSTTSHSGS